MKTTMSVLQKLNQKYGKPAEKLGTGEYGMVYQTEKDFAVKVVRPSDDGGISWSGIQEVALMRLVNSEYCMKALEVAIQKSNNRLLIFMELGKPINDTDILDVPETFQDICQGLADLHSFDVLHLDVKPQNCLQVGDKVKLTDFGISRYQTCVRRNRENVYSLWWRPPEILLDFPATRASDVWAAGVMLLTWLLGELPFPGKTPDIMMTLIFSELGIPTEATWPGVTNSRKYPEEYSMLDDEMTEMIGPKASQKIRRIYEKRMQEMEAGYHQKLDQIRDPVARDLVEKMLEVNPHRRPTIFEVLQHPFFSDVAAAAVNLDPPGCRDNLEENVLDDQLLGEPEIDTETYLQTISSGYIQKHNLGISGMAFSYGVVLFNWCIRHLAIEDSELTLYACLQLGSIMNDTWFVELDRWPDPKEINEEMERILSARDFQMAFTSPWAIAQFQAQMQNDPDLFEYVNDVGNVLMTSSLPMTMGTVELGDLIFDTAQNLRNREPLKPITAEFIPIRTIEWEQRILHSV